MKNLKQSILEKLIITKDTKEKINIDDICEYLSNLFKKYGFDNMTWKLDKDYNRHWFAPELEKQNNKGYTLTNYFICTHSLSTGEKNSVIGLMENLIDKEILINYRTECYNPTHIYICYDYKTDPNYSK